MIETPQITEVPARTIAIIPVTVPRSHIHEVMGPGIQELMATVQGQGVAVTGPWFTHHLWMDPETFNFEIGVPTADAITPQGRVKPSEWPAGRMLKSAFQGDYQRLGEAWGEFDAWAAEHGLETAADLWECYVEGPETGKPASEWRTEFFRAISG